MAMDCIMLCIIWMCLMKKIFDCGMEMRVGSIYTWSFGKKIKGKEKEENNQSVHCPIKMEDVKTYNIAFYTAKGLPSFGPTWTVCLVLCLAPFIYFYHPLFAQSFSGRVLPIYNYIYLYKIIWVNMKSI